MKLFVLIPLNSGLGIYHNGTTYRVEIERLNPFEFRAGDLSIEAAEALENVRLNPFEFRAGDLSTYPAIYLITQCLNPFEFRAGDLSDASGMASECLQS